MCRAPKTPPLYTLAWQQEMEEPMQTGMMPLWLFQQNHIHVAACGFLHPVCSCPTHLLALSWSWSPCFLAPLHRLFLVCYAQLTCACPNAYLHFHLAKGLDLHHRAEAKAWMGPIVSPDLLLVAAPQTYSCHLVLYVLAKHHIHHHHFHYAKGHLKRAPPTRRQAGSLTAPRSCVWHSPCGCRHEADYASGREGTPGHHFQPSQPQNGPLFAQYIPNATREEGQVDSCTYVACTLEGD
mmetsp:Transcript_44669/g.72716  ORF Transcript_44669/g.72716 Transcript_44669/m.72716 type:complete len:238 (-) Transcript_44669:1142-1855(-)